jgi:peptide/nickel transport system permease protein
VRSVLDALLRPSSTRTEKTYSAPLATHAVCQGNGGNELPDGSQARDFPAPEVRRCHLGDAEADWGAM